MTFIQLTPHQLDRAQRVGHLRNDHKIGVVQNKRIDQRQDDLTINIRGLWGELAVAELYHVPIDDVQRLNGDSGLDLEIDGRTVQVKYNTYPHGDLYFNTVDDFICDLAFLTVPFSEREGAVNIIGWITREEFILFHTRRDYGYGSRVIIQQNQLYSFPCDLHKCESYVWTI